MKWRGDQFTQALSAQLRVNCLRACEALTDIAREKVSRQYPPASKPGQPPARRTGNLEEHIHPEQGDAADIDEELAAYVVSDGVSDHGFPYPSHLELNMDRAYLVPTLDENHDVVAECLMQSDIIDTSFGGVL